MKIAELCAGYGGLTLAITALNPDAELVWYAETDPDASTVMATHHPDAPNHGDITSVDWAHTEPVDILAGGIPCQPWSLGGQRNGSLDDRDLWPVRKLDDNGRRRRGMPIRAWSSWPRDGICADGMVWEQPSDVCGTTGVTLPTPCAADGNSRGTGLGTYAKPDGRPLREVIAMLPTPTGSDGTGGSGHAGGNNGLNLRTTVTLLPTPGARLGDDHGIPTSALAANRLRTRRNLDDVIALLPTPRASDGAKGGPNQRGSAGDLALPAAVQPERWGRWATAVARHEAVMVRPAPTPTITGIRGGLRLNPQLTEWMMCLPEGWITQVVEDPNACNRLAGNGVNPIQGTAALRRLGLADL